MQGNPGGGMHPLLSKAIDEAVTKGTPPRYIAFELTQAGWPPPMVHEALDQWLLTHDISFEIRVKFEAWLNDYVKRATNGVILLDVLSALATLTMLLQALSLKIIFDSIFGNQPLPSLLAHFEKSTLLLIVAAYNILLFILHRLLNAWHEALLIKYAHDLDYELKVAYFRHVLNIPIMHQEQLAKGDYRYRQDVVGNSLSTVAIETPARSFESIFRIIAVILAIVLFDPFSAVLAIVLLLLIVSVFKWADPIQEQRHAAHAKLSNEMHDHFVESIDNAETVQTFLLEDKLVTKLSKIWNKNYDAYVHKQMWEVLHNSLYIVMLALSMSVGLYAGGTRVLQNSMTIGTLLMVLVYFSYLPKPTRQLLQHRKLRGRNRKELERVYEIMKDHSGIENSEEKTYQMEFRGKIDFQFVSYNNGEKLILQDVNLRIKPGQKVAIIGAEGTGRSTLLKLLAGFARPTAGKILIDDQDISALPRHELHHNIAWISETPQLFSKTIIENVLDGDVTREITVSEMLRATDAAHVPDFVHNLPLKFNSPVGPKGAKLTYNQRQRIAIARALANDAPIICMDEPAMAEPGGNTERLITDAVNTLMNNRTVLLVTRRPSVLALMDEVYVIENGMLRNVREYGGYELYLHYLQAHEQV